MESLKKLFLRHVCDFVRREDGLVTVEWVALTAAMVVAAVVISYTVMHNTNAEASTTTTDTGGVDSATVGVAVREHSVDAQRTSADRRIAADLIDQVVDCGF